jgi:hypothetical protein
MRRWARGKARPDAGRRASGGRAGALVAAVWLEALRRGGAGVGHSWLSCAAQGRGTGRWGAPGEADGGALVVAHGLR